MTERPLCTEWERWWAVIEPDERGPQICTECGALCLWAEDHPNWEDEYRRKCCNCCQIPPCLPCEKRCRR